MRWIHKLFSTQSSPNRKPSQRVRLRLEPLEDRVNPVTFVVDSLLDTGDANPGNGIAATATGAVTLRAAVEELNALANGVLNTILFDPSTWGGQSTITLNSKLTVSAKVLINGEIIVGGGE